MYYIIVVGLGRRPTAVGVAMGVVAVAAGVVMSMWVAVGRVALAPLSQTVQSYVHRSWGMFLTEVQGGTM